MITTRREVLVGGLAAAAAASIHARRAATAAGIRPISPERRSTTASPTRRPTSTRSTRNGTSRSSNTSARSRKARSSSIRVHHLLYLIMENKTAIRYGVGVGREGFKWYGRATIDRKTLWPKWTPPPEMIKRHPELPAFVEGGSPKNPLSARAMYLFRDGVDTGYRMHGTLEPGSIGTDASSGCIRMFPEYVDRPLSALPDRHGRSGAATYCRPGGQVEAAGRSDYRRVRGLK